MLRTVALAFGSALLVVGGAARAVAVKPLVRQSWTAGVKSHRRAVYAAN